MNGTDFFGGAERFIGFVTIRAAVNELLGGESGEIAFEFGLQECGGEL